MMNHERDLYLVELDAVATRFAFSVSRTPFRAFSSRYSHSGFAGNAGPVFGAAGCSASASVE
jgi:hypothetical protein